MKKLWARLRHKFMMWWSPSYRTRKFYEEMTAGLIHGLTSGEPFTGFSDKDWMFLLRGRQLITMGYEEGDEEE